MKLYQNKGSRTITVSNIISLILMIFAIAAKLIQLSGSYNSTSGLIDRSTITTIASIVFIICIALLVLISIRTAIEIVPTTRQYKLGTPAFVGYVLFAAALLFVIQGTVDLTGHITAYIDYSNAFDEFLLQQQHITPFVTFYFPMAIDVMCLISAVSFFILGMEYVRRDSKKHLILYLIPVFWGIGVVVNIMMGVLETVSIQRDSSKILLCVLMVGYLYYLSFWACGYEPNKKTLFSMCVRLVFPFYAFAVSAPHIITMLRGIKDSNVNVPYFSICGLALYGFVVIIQFWAASVHVMNKKARLNDKI